MRQFSYTDNNTGKTSDESHIVSFKQNSMMQALPFFYFTFSILNQNVYPFSFVAIPVMVMGL